jgi:hypothetical protein
MLCRSCVQEPLAWHLCCAGCWRKQGCSNCRSRWVSVADRMFAGLQKVGVQQLYLQAVSVPRAAVGVVFPCTVEAVCRSHAPGTLAVLAVGESRAAAAAEASG